MNVHRKTINTIGARVKSIRKSEKLTQEEFAERIGISRAHVSGIETNKDKPSSTVIKMIVKEFGVKEKYLTDGEFPVYEETRETYNNIKNELLKRIIQLENEISEIKSLVEEI